MNPHTSRSPPWLSPLDDDGRRGLASSGDGLRQGSVDVRRGLSADLPPGALTILAASRPTSPLDTVVPGSGQPQATLDQAGRCPGGARPRADDRPRGSRAISTSSRWASHVVALERELESTKRDLRQALLVLRELGEEAGTLTGTAITSEQRSRPTRATFNDLQATCLDRTSVDVAGHGAGAMASGVSSPSIATVPQAACELIPKTPNKQPEPMRRVAHRFGPIEAECSEPEKGTVGRPMRTVFVVAEGEVRDVVLSILHSAPVEAVVCVSGEAFLQIVRPGTDACLLTSACVTGVAGLDLVDELRATGIVMPAVVIAGRGDVALAIRAMRAGVSDVLEEPVGRDMLMTCVGRALEKARDAERTLDLRGEAARHVAGLTPRQREIMVSVLAGHPSKNIAADLGISRRTVENHRASIMRKTGTRSLPALVRLALAAEAIV